MTAESLARRLDARRVGSQWMARCPAHDDHKPSLSICEKNGQLLVHCHAGCSQSHVFEMLKSQGLLDSMSQTGSRRIVQVYNYTDERGNLLYEIVRYEPKGFSQRYPDGRGGWIWRKYPRQVLYHLPEVLEAPIVFLVEGERDCETLRNWGFVATSNAGGARAPWLASYSETLRGREVILVPDNDGPGWNRAAAIARALLGVAARLRIFDLPTSTKDITDWFEAGHTEAELIAVLEDVHAA
jgi:DNA primase